MKAFYADWRKSAKQENLWFFFCEIQIESNNFESVRIASERRRKNRKSVVFPKTKSVTVQSVRTNLLGARPKQPNQTKWKGLLSWSHFLSHTNTHKKWFNFSVSFSHEHHLISIRWNGREKPAFIYISIYNSDFAGRQKCVRWNK